MQRRLSWWLLVTAMTAGCWTDACVYGAGQADGGMCVEALDGPFGVVADDDTADWCSGELHVMSSCADLGYTVDCSNIWYRPGSTGTADCR